MPSVKLFEQLARFAAERRPFVIATVVDVSGSSPQSSGARMAVLDDGHFVGTIGGGAIEHQVLDAARQLLRDPERQTRLMKTHLTHDLGMCCGGSMTVFLEKHLPAERLLLFGAGHVARPLAALAHTVGFEVTVVDERAEWLDEARFPNATRVLRHPADAVGDLHFDERTWACVTTHDHQLDQQLVELLLDKPLAWLGMIGSRRKRERFRMRLEAAGFTAEQIARMRTPMGVPIGAVTPEEIAVSVVAELIAVRRGAAVAKDETPAKDARKAQSA